MLLDLLEVPQPVHATPHSPSPRVRRVRHIREVRLGRRGERWVSRIPKIKTFLFVEGVELAGVGVPGDEPVVLAEGVLDGVLLAAVVERGSELGEDGGEGAAAAEGEGGVGAAEEGVEERGDVHEVVVLVVRVGGEEALETGLVVGGRAVDEGGVGAKGGGGGGGVCGENLLFFRFFFFFLSGYRNRSSSSSSRSSSSSSSSSSIIDIIRMID